MWRRYLNFWGRDIDRDLADEVEFHIEGRTHELVDRGWTPEAAEAEARRQFGDAAGIRAECQKIDSRFEREQRMTRYLEDVRDDIRFAFRQFRRQPKFWAVIVLTLVVGIGVSTTIFAIVDGILLRPLPYPEPGNLVHVLSPTWKGIYYHLAARSSTLDLAAYRNGPEVTVATDEDPVRLSATTVTAELFDVLGVPVMLGRPFTAADTRPGSPPVVVLSYKAWEAYLGADPDAIGDTVRIDGTLRTVVGVTGREFAFPSRDTWLWLPEVFDPAYPFSLWGANAYTLIGRLRDGRDPDAARREIRALIPTLADEFPFYLEMPDGYGADAVRPLHEAIVGNVRAELLVLLGAIGAVLLILVANLANLLLARGVAREQEMTTRTALGAGRARLVRQLSSENIVVALVSGTIGTLASIAALRLVVGFIPADLPRVEEIRIDGRVLLFALGLSTAIGLLVSILPAFRSTGKHSGLVPRAAGPVAIEGHQRRATSTLAIAEFALALVLVVSAALLAESLWNLLRVDPGFPVDGLVSARIAVPDSPDRLNDALIERLVAIPGVTSAAVATTVPFDNNAYYIGLGIDGRPPELDDPIIADVGVAVTPGYLETLGVPVLEGRAFDAIDGAESAQVALVSRSFARSYWGSESPIGSSIRLPEQDAPARTIVGVVGDVKWSDLRGRSDPRVLYLPLAQHDAFSGYRRVLVRTRESPETIAANLHGIVRSLDPGTAVSDVRTSRMRIGTSIARPRFAAYLLGGFAAMALFLAGIGVYGVLSYALSRRIPEIGVRIAFGASGGQVFGLLFRQGVRVTLLGIAIGIPMALGTTRFLSSLLFGVEPADPGLFGVVALALVLAGVAVSYLPARRASRVDAMAALRQE